MARINMAAIKIAVAKDETGRLKQAAKQRAEEVFADAVIGLQHEFEDHPVTREIDGGITSSNLSDTLGGGHAPKNLYSFIGFPAGSRPTDEIRTALNPEDTAGPRLRYAGKETRENNARFKFEVNAPDKQTIYKRTPMPWAKGISWAQKIETKIPGFAHFLARFMPYASDQVSRSKGGTQVQPILRGEDYTPPAEGYLTGLFKNFLTQVRAYQKGGLRKRFGQ